MLIVAVLAAPSRDRTALATFAIVGDSEINLIVCQHRDTPRRCVTPETTHPGGSLAKAMGGRYSVAVRARNGKRLDEMLPDVQALVRESPDVVAVNLGTNDALQGNVAWNGSFSQLLRLVLPIDCVILTTISTSTNHLDPTNAHVALTINEAVARASRQPNVRVVDWNAAVAQHGPDFAADGYHPTSLAAQMWLAQAYRKAADSCA